LNQPSGYAVAPSPDQPAHNEASARFQLLVLAVGVVVLGWAYWPNLQALYTIWDKEPNYSHGKLVVPIALAIFWQRLADSKLRWPAVQSPWWSWILLIGVLVGRALAYERSSQWQETATLIPAVACLMLTLGGWPLFQRGWPAVVFLLFMLPLPPLVNNAISLPLQRVATLGSVFIMQLTGLSVFAEGNVITLRDAPQGSNTLEVALACNGLSMLMTLAATVTATVMLIPLQTWKRIIVLISAVPIALLSNIFRIVATGWCYYLIAGERAKHLAHDWSGYLMMPLALVLVGLEVVILSWLAAEDEPAVEESKRPILAIYPEANAGKAITPRPR
jgi:exosortase